MSAHGAMYANDDGIVDALAAAVHGDSDAQTLGEHLRTWQVRARHAVAVRPAV